jgi:hypothetical protein
MDPPYQVGWFTSLQLETETIYALDTQFPLKGLTPLSNMSKWPPQQCSVLLLILLAPGVDGLPVGYIPPAFPDVDPGCIKQCKLLGSLEPMTEIDEYTAPKFLSSSEKYSLENVCGGLDRRADRGAGAGYAWCNLAFEAGTAIASLPPLIGLSYGIQAFDTWSKFMVRAHVHGCPGFSLQGSRGPNWTHGITGWTPDM